MDVFLFQTTPLQSKMSTCILIHDPGTNMALTILTDQAAIQRFHNTVVKLSSRGTAVIINIKYLCRKSHRPNFYIAKGIFVILFSSLHCFLPL